MNSKQLNMVRRLRFILLGPLSTVNMARIPGFFFSCGYCRTIKFMTNVSNSLLSIPLFLYATHITGHKRTYTYAHLSCPCTRGMWPVTSYWSFISSFVFPLHWNWSWGGMGSPAVLLLAIMVVMRELLNVPIPTWGNLGSYIITSGWSSWFCVLLSRDKHVFVKVDNVSQLPLRDTDLVCDWVQIRKPEPNQVALPIIKPQQQVLVCHPFNAAVLVDSWFLSLVAFRFITVELWSMSLRKLCVSLPAWVVWRTWCTRSASLLLQHSWATPLNWWLPQNSQRPSDQKHLIQEKRQFFHSCHFADWLCSDIFLKLILD